MSKTNTKAGATQVSQDLAAQAAAEQAAQQAALEQAAQEQAALDKAAAEQSANSEEATGENTNDKPAGDASEETVEKQETAAKDETLIVTPVAAPAPAPAAQTTTIVRKAVVTEAAQPVAANASVTEQLAIILKDVPAAYQIDINRILTYLERMSPKRAIDSKAGIAEQLALYKAIQTIINRQEQYFTQLFSALLFLFKSEMNGALGDRHRMRFMDNITLHQGDRKAFANITQMLAILADPKSRVLGLKQVNLERALENGLTAEGRNRVLNYFNA